MNAWGAKQKFKRLYIKILIFAQQFLRPPVKVAPMAPLKEVDKYRALLYTSLCERCKLRN